MHGFSGPRDQGYEGGLGLAGSSLVSFVCVFIWRLCSSPFVAPQQQGGGGKEPIRK